MLAPVFHVKRPVLAVGAEWKNCFSLARGDQVFLSPHIGSMATSRGVEFWFETLRRFQVWTGIKPRVIACDLHPDYLSTRLAERLAAELRLPLVRVQHHAAHLLSVMAEHGLSGPVLGLACDGTGYGTDGAIWGCELLEVQPDLSWVRAGHLKYQRLAAAGAEVADPARAAATYLSLAGEDCARLWLRLPEVVSERGSLTSSLGRLFDAVAGITGICRRATFDGEAAIALESAAKPEERRHYPFEGLLDLSVSPALVDPLPLIRDVSRETLAGVNPAVVSARFHNTLVLALGRLATDVARARGIGTVCLSGGSFQNRLLLRGVIRRLESAGLRAYWNQVVPLNDGGLALGQAVAASRRRRNRRVIHIPTLTSGVRFYKMP
jgi:hydrogenase maturation protein HypF